MVQPTTAFFLGLVSAVIGMVIGICDRAGTPAEMVGELPAEEDRVAGTVYYIPGDDRPSSRPADLQARFLGNASPLVVSEGDFNAWSRQALPFPDAPQGDDPVLLILPGPPNARFDADFAQFAVPLRVRLFGSDHNVMLVTAGTFGRSGDDTVFSPETASVGSAPIPPLMVSLVNAFMRMLYRDAQPMPELERAWGAYQSVKAEKGAVTLQRSL